ncbi:hypothetical protein EI94DRAFT_324890 [Lactarius quietus]|nr:hypothetical protein EI94DRAFT_324890 [Lactarius quietus]
MSYDNHNDPGRSLRPHTDAATQNCSCVWCSDVRPTQAGPSNYPVEQQNPRNFGNASIPYPYQGQDVSNYAETAMIAPNRAAHGAPVQTAVSRIQDNLGYAPVQGRGGPPNMEFPWAQTPDASIVEPRRRLAGRYLNNPDAYVSTIRVEPGPSGHFHVIITLEMTDIV